MLPYDRQHSRCSLTFPAAPIRSGARLVACNTAAARMITSSARHCARSSPASRRLRAVTVRSADVTRFRNLNRAYANHARVRDAASRGGADEGVFTPAQLHSAVRAGDRSTAEARSWTGTDAAPFRRCSIGHDTASERQRYARALDAHGDAGSTPAR